MSEKAKQFMEDVWKLRNEGADTEEQLVAGILKLTAEKCEFYHAEISQGNRITVIDRNIILQLSEEIKNLT